MSILKNIFSKKSSNTLEIVSSRQCMSINGMLTSTIKQKSTAIAANESIIIEQSENKKEQDIHMKYKKQYKNLVVCLDNGHASSTCGKRSPYSLNKVQPSLPFEEWKFNREIVHLLIPMLQEYGIDVYNVTPEDEHDIALSTRAQRANDYVKKSGKKGLFLSIHSNACGCGNKWMTARGWSAWTTVGKTNSDCLADCLYNAAERILTPLGQKIRTDKSDGDRDYESNFTVIYKANMPAVLTENMFYDNIEDTKFLNTDEGKKAIAQIHLEGILEFADKIYKM